jgi:hypothetical protein
VLARFVCHLTLCACFPNRCLPLQGAEQCRRSRRRILGLPELKTSGRGSGGAGGSGSKGGGGLGAVGEDEATEFMLEATGVEVRAAYIQLKFPRMNSLY